MKHLKRYKVFGSSKMMYLSKEQLDDMDENDIDQYRSEFIQRNNQDEDFDQYLNELELYREIRFNYNKKFLQKLLDRHVPNRVPESTDDRMEDLLVSVISKEGGFELLNNGNMDELRKKAGTPKYIIGIE
jgi:hypothetical protein